MKSVNFNLVKYEADEGKVFDWAEPRFVNVVEDGEEKQIQQHLYAKTLFLGVNDSITNYIECEE